MTKTRATIEYLRRCQQARTAGYPVAFTTDPAWLLDQAINRRAGWPEDPSESRGSCDTTSHNPKMKRYPWKAQGWALGHLTMLARAINSRTIVRASELGEWRALLMSRIPSRFLQPWEE